VAFSPDGALLAAASWGYNPTTPKQASAPGAVEVWDARTHALLARTPSQGILAGPAFAPGGSLLAYGNSSSGGGAGGTVVLADARTLRPVGPPLSSSSVVRDVTFSPDGRLVAAGQENGTVALWDARTRRPVRTIKASAQQVTAIAFSPDGTTLAAGSLDNMVRLFDVRTGALIAVLNDHTEPVNDVVFSPDGRTLASAGADDAALRTGLAESPCEIGPTAQAARRDQSGGSIPPALR
jgi:WD40 repeat protein